MWGMIATWRMALEGVSKGAEMLGQGGDAGDAVETAVREVEDFPYYKSVGYGGLPNEDMEVEMDAAFMDGDTLDIGAVAAIKDYANPVPIVRFRPVCQHVFAFKSFLMGKFLRTLTYEHTVHFLMA